MGWVMTRTARSPIFSQSHDFSCFIADARGPLISQADGIPIHTGGGGFAVRAILRDFKDDIAPEDVFLLNDPYTAGGNHLPDWVITRPVFVGAKLVAFACNRAHQADIGAAHRPMPAHDRHDRCPLLRPLCRPAGPGLRAAVRRRPRLRRAGEPGIDPQDHAVDGAVHRRMVRPAKGLEGLAWLA